MAAEKYYKYLDAKAAIAEAVHDSANNITVKFNSVDTENAHLVIEIIYPDGADDINERDPETGCVMRHMYVGLPYTYEIDEEDGESYIDEVYFKTKEYGLEISDELWCEFRDEIEYAVMDSL